MNKKRIQILDLMTILVLTTVTLCGAASAREAIGAAALAHTCLLYEPAHYGTTYLYPLNPIEWDEEYTDDMTEALIYAKDLGFTTVIQTFPAALLGSGREDDWLLLLNEAQTVEIDIIAYLWPPTTDTGNPDDPFYYDDLKAFLDVVGDHPALLGYIGLHEPVEPEKEISADELRAFYTEMKDYAPNLKIAHYMGEIAYWEEHREDGWAFSDGMCDVAIVWHYPFRYIDEIPVYEREIVPLVVQPNVALVHERDPDAEMWFLGQSFAYSEHTRNLRMPTPEEMEDLYLVVMQEPVDGFMWYPWGHTEEYDARLGDEGMEEQQEAARNIAETHMGYASLEISKSVFPAGTILYPGDSVTYTLTFTNCGPHVADNTVIADPIPSNLFTPTIVGSSGATVTRTYDVTFAWTVYPLEVGDGGIITLTGVINPDLKTAINITNTAEITAPVARDSATLSSTATIAVSELLNNLEISKSVFPVETAVYPGDTITYTLAFTNYGPRVADSVVITDLVPSDLLTPTIVGSSGAVITRTHGTTFAWTVDPLEVGGGGTITLTDVINPGLETVTSITNTAEITGPLVYDSPTLSSTAVISVSLAPPPAPSEMKIYMPLIRNG